ncbi:MULTISPECIES: SPOR domain-containing protein [unclassified Curtobacterium]|uniref:SPOR domain-containing protein n=1 Tax=unclassified Curtobacterium TaxID=257496 RepID=UPI000D912BDC|nr:MULTISPECIES: SPOR domain-containing protein [unclassified Curtobacterium]PYY32208.1 SPOR domain-containing protein [Curtobacterium sp. MCBD17_030]PZE39315.1 SPOR domain-containing protein [Curtobacterium sp. MCPF17_031]PZF13537.1 SPOR domain-containing protein [Curtobacterium sp. MCPF17_011]
MTDERIESQWWYNDKTGEVEQGPKSTNRHHIGPFPTRDEAAHALDRVRQNNERADAADQES